MSKTVHEKGSDLQKLGLLMGIGNDAIPRQEARGQQSFVNSADLPTSCRAGDDAIEAMGIKLGKPHEEDPVFRQAELPAGWKKQPTDHSMWSDLLDDKGRRRAAIFYKAAFYDRSAHMDIIPRFSVRQNYDDGDCYGDNGMTHIQYRVLDGEKTAYACTKVPVKRGDDGRENHTHSRGVENGQVDECTAWLNERYPDWENRSAYWE